MPELVLTLLSLTLSGSLVALLLFALKPLFRRYLSRSWQYYIWLVVLARLLLPVSPQESLLQLVGERFNRSMETMAPAEAPAHTANQQINPGGSLLLEPADEASAAAVEGKSVPSGSGGDLPFTFSAAEIAGGVWLSAGAVLLLRKVFQYNKLIRGLKHTASPCEDAVLLQTIASLCRELSIALQPAVYINSYVPAPMLAGAFRPFIVLPDNRSAKSDLHFVLRHELVHFKRRDIFFKWAAQVTVCVHWFNPLVYLVQREIGHACELACDEAVIRGMEVQQRSGYGETILSAIKPAGNKAYATVSLSMSEDKKQLKERLVSIMGYKKRSRGAVILAAALTVFLLTGATYAGTYTRPENTHIFGVGDAAGVQAVPGDLNTVTILGDTWYLIDNEAQLRGLGLGNYPLDGKYLLNANITLDKSIDWVPIGTQKEPFTGTFNGNGYEIINLTIADTSVSRIGMFAYAENADIYNVTLRNPDIESAFTPGSSIGPVLVLGKNCNTYDNHIFDPVERDDTRISDTAATGTNSTGYTRRVESLIQDFAPYTSYGVSYDPDSDSVTYNGALVKMFAVFKPYNSGDPSYSFDFFYQDKNAASSLYLEAVRDAYGTVQEIRQLDDTIAEELLMDLEGAYVNQDASRSPNSGNKPEQETHRVLYNFDATFNWINRGITATDKFEPNSAVANWISECDQQQGAYVTVAESPDNSITTYYVYYNGGGRYPWVLDVEGDQLIVNLYSDSHLVTGEGYHLMYITVAQGYSYSGIKLHLDGIEIPIT